MSTNRTDLVGEYLHEVELRLAGLPLLQRRELLADLAAHIAEAQEATHSEGELIEVLERLGSPEAIAAAAHAEAGTVPPAAASAQRPVVPPQIYGPPPIAPPPVAPPRESGRVPGWLIAVIIVVAAVVALGCFGAFFMARGTTAEAPAPASVEAPAVPAEPVPAPAVT